MKTHGPLHVAGFVEPSFQENTYLLWTDDAPQAWIIDPGLPPQAEELLVALRKEDLTPAAIVITHGHVDHIAGIEELRREFPELPIVISADEADMLTDPAGNLSIHLGMSIVMPAATRLVVPGDKLTLGALSFEALDVSGHSPGGLAYYCAEAGVVLTGDALFAGSIGRTDFPGGSMRRLCDNIRRNLLTLPDDTVAYSGHGPPTTIARERGTNPFLHGEGI